MAGGSDLHGDGSPPTAPTPAAVSTTTPSTTPQAENAVAQSPSMPTASLTAAEIGLPP